MMAVDIDSVGGAIAILGIAIAFVFSVVWLICIIETGGVWEGLKMMFKDEGGGLV